MGVSAVCCSMGLDWMIGWKGQGRVGRYIERERARESERGRGEERDAHPFPFTAPPPPPQHHMLLDRIGLF